MGRIPSPRGAVPFGVEGDTTMNARLLVLAVLLVFFGASAFGSSASAEPIIATKCLGARCEATEGVLSVPVGATVEFSVQDKYPVPRETVKWVFSDGTELYGTPVQKKFLEGGKVEVSLIIYYEDGTRATKSMTIHAVSPIVWKIFGVSESTVYAVAALVVGYIISYLSGLLGW